MKDVLKKYEDHIVDSDTQKRLNEPLKDESGWGEGHEAFLKMLLDKIESGEINTHDSKSLYNQDVYNALSESDQEKADLTGVNLMSIIRQIENLQKMNPEASFQMQNLVQTVFQMKSTFENQYGDVYII